MEIVELKSTKKNDVFKISLGENKIYEINGKSGGKDTIKLEYSGTLSYGNNFFIYQSEHTEYNLGKDLEIVFDDGNNLTGILIKNYFTSTNGTATKSSIKYLEINGEKYLLSDCIYYYGEIRPKKGVYNGTMFNDQINGTNGDDKIFGKGGVDLISGGDGDDYIDGGSGYDILEGGKGNDIIKAGSGLLNYLAGDEDNDKLYAGSGKDAFMFSNNHGNDTIFSAKQNDTLSFDEMYNFNDFEFFKEKNHLVIQTGVDSSIKLSNYFKGKEGKILDEIWTTDSNTKEDIISSISNQAIINVTGKGKINGTNYNDNITGSDKKDTIKTGKGVNIVDGNGGNDYIDSTKGNNTIVINDGDGNDTILAGANSETHLLFDPYKEFSFTKKGNDLIITHQDAPMDLDLDEEPNNAPETVTLKNYFKTDKKGNLLNKNVTINHDEYGNIYNREDLLQVLQNEKVEVLGKENKANKIDLRKYQDTFDFNVIGGNKNDKIYLGAGDHIISSGAGNDTITVGNGYNKIDMGAGNDKVKAGNGVNTFYYTSGKDVIESGIGDDKYYVEYSSDMNLTIKDNGGYDILYTEDIDNNDLHVFLNINKSGDIVISDNKSAILNNVYIFGSDEEGNSMLSYENILKGMKGKDMSGVIEIERCLEKSFDINNAEIKFIEGRGYIEQINNGGLNIEEIASEVGNWLSSYKNGAFESSVDVLSRGSQDDINAMLAIYNNQNFSEYE